ncbi:hypothetical protein PG994_006996 [Apiospora phragmitis]|uniref:Nephrocystin 3-like N-terminal domain-containing protein n=1 Tax=Apiospora phragmitis TaxID=2905665 RepID=A0ABR1UZM9_9PEZI
MSDQALVRLPRPSLAAAPPRDDGAVSSWGPAGSGDSTITQGTPFDDEPSGENYVLSTLSPGDGAMAPLPGTVIARWRNEIESLSSEQRDRFLRELPGAAGIQTYVDSVGGLISDKVKNSRSLRVGRWIAPLVELVNMSKPFADALNSVYPPAGMVLGGVSCVLSMSKRYVDYQEAILAFLVKACKNLGIIDRYKAVFPETEEMQLALMDVYGDIIQFCSQASKLFLDDKGKNRMTAVPFFKSQLKTFEAGFGELGKDFETHLGVFDRAVMLGLGKMATHLQKMQLMGLEMQVHSHEADKRHRTEEEERRIKALAKDQDEFRQRILDWISTLEFRKVQDEKLENTLPGTAQWLLEHDIFKSWKLRSHPNLLYLHGKPGSGKSHLAARLIRELDLWCREHNASLQELENQPRYALAYVYCTANLAETSSHKNLDRTSETTGGAGAILSSILRQLYSFLPKNHDIDLLKGLYRENQASNPVTEDMREGIKLVVANFARAFIVIDGLDECNGFKEIEFENLCSFICSLASSSTVSTPASVIIFSRPGYSAIEDALGEAASIQVDIGANQADIDTFITERTRNLTSNSINLQDIKSTLSGNADGMFLWVKLAVDSIRNERTDNKRKQAARNMPRGLTGPYSAALNRIMAQEESVKVLAFRALLWIANSQRPLTKPELLDALSIEPGMTDLEPGDRIDDLSLAKDCADLVLFRNGRYSLVHFSLKEYLTHQPLGGSESFAEYWDMQSKSHAILAELCLTYLMFDTFKIRRVKTEKDRKDLMENYPLLGYSAAYWGNHVAKVAATEKTMILSLAKLFLESNNLLHLWGHVVSAAIVEPLGLQPLHLMSFFGLTELLPFFDPNELQLDLKDQHGQFPLDLAFRVRQKVMAEWLIRQHELSTYKIEGKLPSKYPLLWLAARNNWADIIAKLLNMGLDKNQVDEAALSLIDAGVDVNIQNSTGGTALMIAIALQRFRFVHALLDRGADITLFDTDGRNALHYAIRYSLGNLPPRVTGSNADSVAKLNTNTGLGLATTFGGHDLIGVILDHGADINRPDKTGTTPLAIASSTGDLTALKILLSRGARITTRTGTRSSIFHQLFLAPPSRRINVLIWLLQHGDEYGESRQIQAQEAGESLEPGSLTAALLFTQDSSGRAPLQRAVSCGDVQATNLLLETPLRKRLLLQQGDKCLKEALELGHFDCSQVLLDACSDVIPQFPSPNEPLMAYAAKSGNAALIPLVLSHGGSPSTTNDLGETPLLVAVDEGRVDFVRSLIEQVANVDYYHKADAGEISLHWAAQDGNLELLELLLPYYEVDKYLGDVNGNWPIHLAAACGELDCVKALINFDSDGSGRRNGAGDTPLYLAAQKGSKSVVDYLLGTAKVDVNAANRFGSTPLHKAIIDYRTEVALSIISYGASLSVADEAGWTVLHYAAEMGNEVEVVELYLSRGLDEVVRRRGPGRNCALAAAKAGNLNLWLEIVGMEESLAHDVDEDYDGALAIASIFGQTHMLRFILTSGLDVNSVGAMQNSVLQSAAHYGNLAAVQYLCQEGASLDHQDSYGRTTLHWAFIDGYESCQRALIDAGVNQLIRDDLGFLARDYDPYLAVARSTSKHSARNLSWSTACKFVIESIRSIKISQTASGDGTNAKLRNDLSVLSNALYLLRDLQTAAIIELKRQLSVEWEYTCGIYDQEVEKDETCHCESANPPFARPLLVDQLETMERELVLVRKVLRPIAHSGYYTLVQVLSTAPGFWAWVEMKAERYDDWKADCERERWNFNQSEIPGWELIGILSLLRDELNTKVKPPVPKPSLSETSLALDVGLRLRSRLRTLYRYYSPDLERNPYGCEGHEYLKITPVAELPDDMKAMLDSENNLTEVFFETVEKRYNERARALIVPDDDTQIQGIITEPYSYERSVADLISTGNTQHVDLELELPEEHTEASKNEGSMSTSSTASSEGPCSIVDKFAEEDWQIYNQIGSIRRDLLMQWKANQLGRNDKAQKEQETVLETAWQLAQAIGYHGVLFESLEDLHRERMDELTVKASSGKLSFRAGSGGQCCGCVGPFRHKVDTGMMIQIYLPV